jgi:DNA topoisomerase I
MQMKEKSTSDMPATAKLIKAADLVYSTDAEPGIRRKRAGKGFAYTGPDGQRIGDKDEISRIKALAIPPAYRDVWICADPDGHIQATGRDDRGRKQYRYHPRWSAMRAEVKFDDLVGFARLLPEIRARTDADLRRRTLGREKVVASVVWLLDNLLIRVGNSVYARENKSFGVTTLRKKHLDISGSRMTFRFKGKSGKQWNLSHTDRRIAGVIRSIHELSGQHLFQYEDEEGSLRPVRSHDINGYIRDISGGAFSSRQFRTWGGTFLAAEALSVAEPAATKRERVRVLNQAIDAVAAQLGNTRSVCRQSYIHPSIIESYEAGELATSFAAIPRSRAKAADWLEDGEMRLLKWLEKHA